MFARTRVAQLAEHRNVSSILCRRTFLFFVPRVSNPCGWRRVTRRAVNNRSHLVRLARVGNPWYEWGESWQKFADSGHPILLRGNPREGSIVMVARPQSEKRVYGVNHGAGRRLGRRDAIRKLDQAEVDAGLARCDVMSNCRQYPKDEAPDAYNDFDEVVRSVELAKLARGVARLKARFVIEDSSDADD